MGKKVTLQFSVGDLVKLRDDSGLKFETEEASLDETYEVEDIRWSPLYGHYVRLKGVISDYAFNWVEKTN